MKYLLSLFALDYGLPNVNASPNKMADIFNLALAILGAIAVLVIVIAGIEFMVAAGNPEKISKARNAIIYAAIGLIVAIFSAVIVNFVIKGLASA